jgi:mannose-6-phosphate isomerase-like protein (cupin superfamily)
MPKTTRKPWGYEYLLYQNDDVAIWHLFIDAYQKTSLHSHPNKKTGLVVLDGAAKISFLGSESKLFYGEKIMIRQGVFHQTASMTPHTLQLLEIETPVDKEDIVRLEDSYGRAGSTNMGEDGIDIHPIDIKDSQIGKCNISFKILTPDLEFNNFIITSGIISHSDLTVAGPGDILSYNNMLKLITKFDITNEIHGIAIRC